MCGMYHLFGNLVLLFLVSFIVKINEASQSEDFCASPDDADCDSQRRPVDEVYVLSRRLIDLAQNYSTDMDDVRQLFHLVNHIRSLQETSDLFPLEGGDKYRGSKLTAFLRWCFENIDVDGVTIARFPNYGFGIKTFKDLPAQHPMIRLTFENTFNTYEAKATFLHLQPVLQVAKMKFKESWSDQLYLALKLMSERLNPNSFFKPYLDVLPGNFLHPIFFGTSEHELLEGSLSYKDCVWLVQEMVIQYAMLYRHIHDKPDSCARFLLTTKTFTFDAFRWAFSMAVTRSYDMEPGAIMIPFWDMANHGEHMMNTMTMVNPPEMTDKQREKMKGRVVPEGRIVSYCSEAIPANTQVFTEYSTFPTSKDHMFSTWGFISENTTISLPLNIRRTDSFYRRRYATYYWLRKKHRIRGYDVTVFRNEKKHFPYVLPIVKWDLNLLRALACGKKRRIRNERNRHKVMPQSEWRKMWRYFGKLVIRMLARYKHDSTWYEDVQKTRRLTESELLVVREILSEHELLLFALKQSILLSHLPAVAY